MFGILGLQYTPNILVNIGLLLALAFLGSKIFQRMGIPQVVGFIVVGVVLGSSFLNIVPLDLVEELSIISQMALGLIGFDMGSHLHYQDLRDLGRSITTILIFEAFGTFFLVTLGIYMLTQSWSVALIFGALSSATAPAATVDVLAEYDARGPLTTTLLAVVGFDDAVALLLYSVAAAVAEWVIRGKGNLSTSALIRLPLLEIGGSLLVGLFMGMLLDFILHRLEKRHDAMAISIGFVLLCGGLSEALGFSLILTNMILGVVVVNRNPEHARHIRFTIEQAGPVIYVLFFALVGARFQINFLPTMGLIGVLYVVLRSVGKFTGSWIGGRLGGASQQVRNNLGFGLLSQAGVAMGLSIASARRFNNLGEEGAALSTMIVNVILATTFIVQIIGPIFVKVAIQRAGEIGRAKLSPEAWASEGTPE